MDRNTFILTVALALIIGSVCSLLVQWRALHDALIVGFPVVTLAVIAWLVWRYWPRGHKAELPPPNRLPPDQPAFAARDRRHRPAVRIESGQRRAPPIRVDNRHSSSVILNCLRQLLRHGERPRGAAGRDAANFRRRPRAEVVPLFGDDVAVQQFTVKNGSAELVRDGDNIAAQLNRRGNVTLQIKMLVKIAGDVTKRRLTFGIPPALSSQVALVLDESGGRRGFSDGDCIQAHSGQGQNARRSRDRLRRPH